MPPPPLINSLERFIQDYIPKDKNPSEDNFYAIRNKIIGSSRYMENTHFSVHTSSRFSWKSSGTAWKTEEFHPLETHTAEAQRVFGPGTSWTYQSLFQWGHSPMTDRSKERKPSVGKPCQNQRDGCFSWETSSGIGGRFASPKVLF